MSGSAPESVTCDECGAPAMLVPWGNMKLRCFRCIECRAGGHEVQLADSVIREGPVFGGALP